MTICDAPKVLVLMATFNGEPWIKEQIRSIFSQENVEVSLLVGDDCSSDQTRALIAANCKASRLCFHDANFSSGSAGANFRRLFIAADVGNFDYVALSDQDDIWLPNKLTLAINALKLSGAVGYSSSVEAFWEGGKTKVINQCNDITSVDFLFEGAGQGCTYVLTNKFFKNIKEFCKEFPGAAESLYFHDWMIYLLSRGLKKKWYFDQTPTIKYRQHGKNDIGARGGLYSVKFRLKKIFDGWYSKQILSALSIYKLAGGNDLAALAVGNLLESDRTIFRNLHLAVLLLKSGRRRIGDRAILFLASIFGRI